MGVMGRESAARLAEDPPVLIHAGESPECDNGSTNGLGLKAHLLVTSTSYVPLWGPPAKPYRAQDPARCRMGREAMRAELMEFDAKSRISRVLAQRNHEKDIDY